MRVRYTDEGIADVQQILLCIAERNTTAAEVVSIAIERTAARVGRCPYSAQATDEPGVHMVPIGGFLEYVYFALFQQCRNRWEGTPEY